jgi:hypothetical protein
MVPQSPLHTARYALLADLAAAGVTDLMAETPCDWRQAAPISTLAVDAPTPAPVAATAQATAAYAALATPAAPAKAPVSPVQPKQSAEAPFDVAPHVRVEAGSQPYALVLTVPDVLAWPASDQPEGRLLGRLFAALGLDWQACTRVLVRENRTSGALYTADDLSLLAEAVRAQTQALGVRSALVFGQVALSACVGKPTPLAAAQSDGVEMAATRLFATYQPQALLEQPRLKGAAWRQALSFAATFSKL